MASEERPHRKLLAEHLCNLQPAPIRVRLLDDGAFCTSLGLSTHGLLTVGSLVHIDQGQLFKVARSLLATRAAQELSDVDGRSFRLCLGEDTVVLEDLPGREQPWAVEFPELMMLSPHRDERVDALGGLTHALGPTSPDFSALAAEAVGRDLRDEEVTALVIESCKGVAAVQAQIERALAKREAGVADLVPAVLSYYERFCGPDPGDALPEDYLGRLLPLYRKTLLGRDLIAGLDICFLGCLRDNLSPGAWIAHQQDDVVWPALAACETTQNPFCLLGALDVALLRQHDERFRCLAEACVSMLLQESLPRPDGIDTYEWLPLLAELVLNWLNTREGAAIRPPFWRRMAAWTHAGFLLRATSEYRFDLMSFQEWVQSQCTLAGDFAKALDLRREPMYSATVMSAGALRKEVLGRLVTLRRRHEADGRSFPKAGEIDAKLLNSRSDAMRGWWAFPGPLEGHQRPAEITGRALPAEAAVEFTQKLGFDPSGPLFSTLAYQSQWFDLKGPILDHARDIAQSTQCPCSIEDRTVFLGKLTDGCLCAAAHRDTALANAIGKAALSGAHLVSSGEEVHTILRCLLLAAAAFEDEDSWAEWIEEQLFQLAARLPHGEPSEVLLVHLRELKSLLDLTLCIHGRAEALASAATRR